MNEQKWSPKKLDPELINKGNEYSSDVPFRIAIDDYNSVVEGVMQSNDDGAEAKEIAVASKTESAESKAIAINAESIAKGIDGKVNEAVATANKSAADVTRLEVDISTFEGETEDKIATFESEVTAEVEGFKQSVTADISAFKTSTNTEIDRFETGVEAQIVELSKQITEKQGTKVTVSGSVVEFFDSDIKADKPNQITATLLSASWAADSIPGQFVQTLTLPISSNDILIVGSGNPTTEQYDAFLDAEIYSITHNTDKLTFRLRGEVPKINLPIEIIKQGGI